MISPIFVAMLNSILANYIKRRLNSDITDVKPVSGGSINRTYLIETLDHKYFIKLNNKTRYPEMFEAEARGLNLIAQTNTIKTPEIILQDSVGDESFFLLEWIKTRRPTAKASAKLGEQLAAMHRNFADKFGLDTDNYMGSLHQSNKKHNTWAEFFSEQRLQPMVKMAIDKGLLTTNDLVAFEHLYKKLPGLFDEELPTLIHGDLWGGNYIIDLDEQPYLIDPAVSYGNREFDLAMTTLFGGFSNEFYVAYNEAYPLIKGWQQRMDLWNLYPLLVHLNLFGAGYAGQVRDCLLQYV
ncbi:fructosamine kinase family protein [Mucilaginibacter sp. L3T2-6]|nr:fructosamine kinase family protein [Mucilaginibacter sp. L3T2-6]